MGTSLLGLRPLRSLQVELAVNSALAAAGVADVKVLRGGSTLIHEDDLPFE